jgi:hypothetical protein
MEFPKGRSAALPLVAIGVLNPMAKYIFDSLKGADVG